MSHERVRRDMSPVALDTTSSSSEGADHNPHSSSSSSPSLTAALRNFDIGDNSVRENSRGARSNPYDEPTHMGTYMEYLALLNHRQAQQLNASGAAGDATNGTGAAESSLFANSVVSSPFGVMSAMNDENGDSAPDDGGPPNEAENNNDISSGSRDQELSFVDQEEYSPSTSDPGSSSERREETRSGNFMMDPTSRSNDAPKGRSFRVPNLTRLDLDSTNGKNDSQGSSGNSQKFGHCGRTFSTHSAPQPLQLTSSTRLKITLLKWNVAAAWKWTAGDETCGICRMPFEACCIECKTPGDECPLALGACKHAFHMHCIVKWTETQNTARPQCPLCRQEWKFAPG